MPIHRIQVKEYECTYCGYRWTNRINGKDGPIPKNCAKCKRRNWDAGDSQKIWQKNGLRRRIKGFKEIYDFANSHFDNEKRGIKETITWPNGLSEKFLDMTPAPTIEELKIVVFPPGLRLEPLDSQNQYTWKGYVPDPESPGYLEFNPKEWVSLRRKEAEIRQRLMQRIIDSRKKIIDSTYNKEL